MSAVESSQRLAAAVRETAAAFRAIKAQRPRGAGSSTPTLADAVRRNTPEMVALLTELDKRYGRK